MHFRLYNKNVYFMFQKETVDRYTSERNIKTLDFSLDDPIRVLSIFSGKQPFDRDKNHAPISQIKSFRWQRRQQIEVLFFVRVSKISKMNK